MRALLLVLLVAGTALAGCTSPVSDPRPEVELHSDTFAPRDLAVSLGDTVTFTDIAASHTIDFAEGTAAVEGVSNAHSGNINPGETRSVTFTKAGSYAYFCQYHSSVSGGQRIGMVGTITVG